ncbi:hypothetical protein C8J57DRAFT_1241289 [Mycena rebaudengoi]|nr:hypothetical protein C8J57DRAFT_1241289 [Mycena rebaudengoi]
MAKDDPTFTDAQITYLKTFEAQFRAHVLANSTTGDKATAEKAARGWKNDHTDELLVKIKSDFPYPAVWARSTSDPDVKRYIRRFFGNFLHGNLVRTGILQPTAVPTHNALFTAPRPSTGRELFEQESKDDVANLSKNLQAAAGGTLNPAGCYQTALATLWDGADDDSKAKFQDAAAEQAQKIDIPRNQTEFEKHIGGALDDLCGGGSLGHAEMVLFASFRDENDALTTFAIHGHSEKNQRSFEDFAPEFATFRAHWDTFSAETIPTRSRPDRAQWDSIPRNDSGSPLFPSIDFDNTTRSGLAQVTELFFRVCWDHAWPADAAYGVLPLTDIKERPDEFYDTERFDFHPRLGVPFHEMSLSHLSGIVEELIKLSATDDPPDRRPTTPANDTQHNSPPPPPESPPATPKALTPTPHPSPKVPKDTNPPPPPPPPATAEAVDGAVNSTKKRARKRKAESQLVPETAQDSSSSSGRAPRVRKTAAEASADRRQKALDDAARPKAKPGWEYIVRSPKK